MKKENKKGFTLIEMLVVIAIIAVLVAIIIPTVTSATTKANAATDAANLRSILAVANTVLLDEPANKAAAIAAITPLDCKTFPGAQAYIYYVNPGFIIAYYDNEGTCYTIDSFAETAATGAAPAAATLPEGGTPYPVGGISYPVGGTAE